MGRNKRESVWALGKERVGYKCIVYSGETKKNKFTCVYKYTCAVPLLLHLFIVLCLCECVHAEEGSQEKINEEGTSTSNSLFDSCSGFDSERGSSKEI